MKLMTLAIFLLSANAFAATELQLGITSLDVKTSAKVEGEVSTAKRKGTGGLVGLNSQLTEDLSLGIRYGYADVGSDSKFFDRNLKVLPSFSLYRLNEHGDIYGFGGIGAHSILFSGKAHNAYTGNVGLGFKSDLGAPSFRLSFEALYEQSFAADDYKINGVKVKDFELKNFEAAAAVGYTL